MPNCAHSRTGRHGTRRLAQFSRIAQPRLHMLLKPRTASFTFLLGLLVAIGPFRPASGGRCLGGWCGRGDAYGAATPHACAGIRELIYKPNIVDEL
ncbi:MAG: hypothetical protein A3G20_09160 [Acidobacteria bacterium RIFCSPLOWO2_12_FULL_59_11]|nr:MAG: hypothetical protein A3G20_09160 [Acidobacteria bacterium RIFCSPLOWO2_12_FULL_59_11]